MIGIFGGFFQFAAGLIEELLGFLRVTAQFVLVGLLRFIDFFSSLEDMVLDLGEVWVPGRVNICFRPLGRGHSDKRQADRESNR
jgi:hypothetical protein